MEIFHVSEEEMIALHQQAALGRLVHGLIHNLNSPLHALGIEMEMMSHVIAKSDAALTPLAQDALRRLRRMGQQFESLIHLIRSAAARADLLQGPPEYLHLNTLLQQELEFMKTNLYFKHNVRTSVHLGEGVPPFSAASQGLGLGIVWFLQGLIEEIEKARLSSLTVRTAPIPPGACVAFITGGGRLSPEFQRLLTQPGSPLPEGASRHQMAVLLALRLLRDSEVAIEWQSNSGETEWRLLIPAVA